MRVIYKVINVINNKFYIGSAVKFSRRKASHLRMLKDGNHSNKHLQAAWNKYGPEAFVIVVVEEVSEDANILEIENKWLKDHVGKDYCYNVARDATAPGLGMVGELSPSYGRTFNHTEEAKQKISVASSARVQSDEEKVKRRATMRGHSVSTETRLKISISLSGDKNFNYGKPRSDSFKEKVSRKVCMIKPNGMKHIYPSILALREATGLKPSTVNNALKHGRPMRAGPYKGWKITDYE